MCKQMELTGVQMSAHHKGLVSSQSVSAWSRLLPGVLSSLSWEVFKPCDLMAGQGGEAFRGM